MHALTPGTCITEYGQCGVGAFCLGGCDPRMSFSLDSCVPAPVCKSKTYKMDSTDRIMDIGKYLGDPEKADWMSQGEAVAHNGYTLLTMPPKSVGTVLASTTYMWYGSVKVRMKTSRGKGVVTAFILMSDVKDEIDYEWVGTQLTTSQTNYYFQGIPDCMSFRLLTLVMKVDMLTVAISDSNSANITLSDTYANWHEYEIQWTPDEIKWLVDGQVGRTTKKSSTWNATANQWNFPQTPSRVQLSLWPGGLESNAKGTIDWAGGVIDWESEEIKKYGYYFASVGEITIDCWDAKSGAGTNKGVSYYYNDIRATNDTVVDSNKPTVLKSFLGTGMDMDKGTPSKSSGSGSGSSATPSTPNSIPGGGNAPPAMVPGGGAPHHEDDGQDGSGEGGTGTDGAPACEATGFTQNCNGNGGNGTPGSNAPRGVDRTLGGSAFAVIVGFAALLLF